MINLIDQLVIFVKKFLPLKNFVLKDRFPIFDTLLRYHHILTDDFERTLNENPELSHRGFS